MGQRRYLQALKDIREKASSANLGLFWGICKKGGRLLSSGPLCPKDYRFDKGLYVGEVIDLVLEGYEEYTNSQDELIKETDISDQLSTLLEKVERIEKKVGA